MRPLTKYSLLHLPGLAFAALLLLCLWRFLDLPGWIAALLFAAWLVKDVAFYPLLRHAYASNGATGEQALVGRHATVRRALTPAGLVTLGSELWRAEVEAGAAPIAVGTTVRVIAARGMTLVVAPAGAPPPPSPQS